MTWGDNSSQSQMKNYSTVTKNLKSFSHNEGSSNKLAQAAHQLERINEYYNQEENKKQSVTYEQNK